MGRFLRSKRLRAALWMAADGRCQRCGESLIAGWHADHVVPWVESQRTNVHEMAALCGPCNLKKGATTMRSRAHQIEAEDRAASIVSGKVTEKVTLAAVTPGGGKTLMAAAFARVLMDGRRISRVCWVCPRSSLALQSAEGFTHPLVNPVYRARRADNTVPLIRDELPPFMRVCYTTTYQSIAAQPDIHRDQFDRGEFLLILDEPHHLVDDEEGGVWARALQPLVARASHVLLMSGTVERADGKRLPFVSYRTSEGRSLPDVHIAYTRRDALMEGAILPMHFTYADGSARYLDGMVEKTVEVSKSSESEYSKVLSTILGRTEYRDALVSRGMNEWTAHHANVYPSRAIIICASQVMARDVRDFVAKNYQTQVALAISDDDDSQHTIDQFRKGTRGKVLVTVGMAYEGLDVPDVTHLVCLTNIRSTPWLEQAFARATRVDHKAVAAGVPYDRQGAHIYVPDDPRMRDVVEKMRNEQAIGLIEREKVEREKREQGERQQSIFVGLDAKPGEVGFGTVENRLPLERARLINTIKMTVPEMAHVSAEALERALAMVVPAAPKAETTVALSVDDEAKLRKAIETIARSRDGQRGEVPGTTNRLIRSRFRKSRESMGIAELREVLAFLEELNRRAA